MRGRGKTRVLPKCVFPKLLRVGVQNYQIYTLVSILDTYIIGYLQRPYRGPKNNLNLTKPKYIETTQPNFSPGWGYMVIGLRHHNPTTLKLLSNFQATESNATFQKHNNIFLYGIFHSRWGGPFPITFHKW